MIVRKLHFSNNTKKNLKKLIFITKKKKEVSITIKLLGGV